ncbi:MAG TPA: DEAD/DEAH box helicase family protein, partial [Candidatus Hydrogenedentes bacterium]|nr:DEAD/DEAH box helicase family protein [Candidatus Hydrogenedentota bacterium]
MELRPYQHQALDAIEKGWDEFRRQLLVLPTGTGKTIVF